MLPIPDALKSDFPGKTTSFHHMGVRLGWVSRRVTVFVIAVSNQGPGGLAADHEDDTEASEAEPAAALRSAPQDVRPAQAAAIAIRKMRETQDSPSKRLDLLAGMWCCLPRTAWLGTPTHVLSSQPTLRKLSDSCSPTATAQRRGPARNVSGRRGFRHAGAPTLKRTMRVLQYQVALACSAWWTWRIWTTGSGE
jgi:hypothetical protein